MTLHSDRSHEATQQGADSAEVAAAVIRRMNLRTRILGWISMILWLLVAAGVVAYTWFLATYVVPILVAVAHYSGEDVSKYEQQVRVLARVLPTVAEITLTSACAWAGLVVLAAACTLLYVGASRKATLRQIHAGLAEISEQLKTLSSPHAVE